MTTNDRDTPAPSPGWSARHQWIALVVAAVSIGAVIVLVMLASRGFGHRGPGVSDAQTAAGGFRPTPQQLKSLTIESATRHEFVSQEITEAR